MNGLRAVLQHRILGLLFIGLMVFAVWLVYAIFQQKFTSFDKVTLTTSTVGLQLPDRADVKIRGVLIGEVLDRHANGTRNATLTLGIHPNQIGQVPQNVTASILPKTLFGEKYVQLDIPKRPATASLQGGDHIAKTQRPIEVQKILRDIYPLLRTVQPAEINYTLNALATALEGRGQQIGQSIVTLDNYLKRLNPQVPALVHDLRLLSQVSGTYADVAPEIAATLRNTVRTGGTLIQKQAALHQFLRNVSGLSDTATSFLNANGDNIIELGRLSRPELSLLQRYSPEYPCLLKGLVNQIPSLADTFRGFVFHISAETIPYQPRGYNPSDRQVYGAHNPPTCAGLPNPPGSQAHPYGSPGYGHIPNVRDGVDDNGGTLRRHDGQRPPTGFARIMQPTTFAAGTPSQQAKIRSLAAPALGVPADRVPGVATMLFGPLAAGTKVSAR
ncbi:MAG: MCE family protein [Marmoricola sp.]